MNRATIALSVSVCLVACALIAGCANPADNKSEALVRDAAPTGGGGGGGGGTIYTIDSKSQIGFVGSKVTGSHDGGFNGFEGTIAVVDGAPESSRVEVTIDMASIWSDNPKLTGHLKSPDFFAVETYPTAKFVSTEIEANDAGFSITGNLDLHGVTKSVTFPAQITPGADSITAKAEFVIKRFDWNIEYRGPADNLIRDEVVIKLDLVATSAADEASGASEDDG